MKVERKYIYEEEKITRFMKYAGMKRHSAGPYVQVLI